MVPKKGLKFEDFEYVKQSGGGGEVRSFLASLVLWENHEIIASDVTFPASWQRLRDSMRKLPVHLGKKVYLLVPTAGQSGQTRPQRPQTTDAVAVRDFGRPQLPEQQRFWRPRHLFGLSIFLNFFYPDRVALDHPAEQ